MWPDIYIANDKLTYNTLLRNNRDGTFSDVSERSNANARMNAMCVNPGDYNNDGWMDIYITNTPVGSQYLENQGGDFSLAEVVFANIAEQKGIHFPGGNCWGSNFLDADNDGDLDLYVSSSIITPRVNSSVFYENIDATAFSMPTVPGMQGDSSASYTNAVGDFNNDGLIDIVVQNNPPHDFFIWQNTTDLENNWVKIDLEGVLSNRDAIGVRIEAYAGELYHHSFTLCGSGFLGQNSSYKHIGLGEQERIDSLVITWPTGHVDKLYDLTVNQLLTIREGQSTDGDIQIADGIRILQGNLTTSIYEIDDDSISISPNPGSSTFTIQSVSKLSEIKIIDYQGRLISLLDQQAHDSQIDASYLSPGVYFVRALDELGQFKTFKWVKL